MRRAGVAKTAAHFRGGGPARIAVAADDDYDGDKGGGLAGAGGTCSAPRQVVGVLYAKWSRQLQRWSDYRSLASLLAFIAVFLGVLYAQRGATTAYQVHSTIAAVVLPPADSLSSTQDMYDWLQGLLRAVWVDPTCGDGMCEAPFEFAAFSRFGCKADCGRLADIQNLTSTQVDVYWDFAHQAASLPAAELMRQASWNLCPTDIAYSTACYDDPDNSFASIAGSASRAMPDLPDGDWSLVINKDIFQKTRGAVRDTSKLSEAAFWYKAYVAAAAAAAEQAYERSLLGTAARLLATPLLDALPAVWNASGQGWRDAFDAAQMRNASCLCGSNATVPLAGTVGYVDEAAYLAANCSGVTQLGERTYDADGNATLAYTPSPSAAACDAAVANLTAHRASYNATLLSLLVSQRLGNLRDTGKFGVRAGLVAGLRAFLAATYPELLPGVFTQPSGADPTAPAAASVEALAQLYVEGPAFLVAGAPANLALFRRRLVQDPAITFADWANRTAARLAEIDGQQASVAALSLTSPAGRSASVGQLRAAFAAAGANATWLPGAPALGSVAVDYNLAAWQGNTTAYLTCALELRGPEYLGACSPLPVACTPNTGNDTVPYNCTRASVNSSVPGSIRNATYREGCELPCDMQLDCNTLCECWGSCASGSVCICPACRALHADAAADSAFFTIRGAAASAGAASADVIAATSAAPPGRRLLQAAPDVTAALAGVLAKVDELRSSQASLAGQVTALQGQVDKANLLAEARAASTKLQDLIAAGRSDIASGQALLEGKLNTLLQRQQAALDALAAASSTLAAIQSLSQRQADALASLEATTTDRLNAISVATQQGVLNLYQALAVWKLARRDRALSTKITKLAGSPCSYEPALIRFSVNNSNAGADATARERRLGLSNRVLAGLLLHTWRSQPQRCPQSRFSGVQSVCQGPLDTTPYGVDSVFKMGSPNFNPDLYDPDGTMVTAIYNCSQLARPTYGTTDPVTGLPANTAPFCAELFNPRGVPYAFRHFPLPGLPSGFPAFLDINLSQEGAATWASWLQEGLLLDGASRGLLARLVTYNSELKVFAAITLTFDFNRGGSIKVSHRIYTLSLELYDGSVAHLVRYAFEVLLAAGIGLLVLLQLKDMALAACTRRGRRQGGLAAYLSSGGAWLKLASNGLLLLGVLLWWTFVTCHAKTFAMAPRYNVYADLQPQAYFLRLADDGAGLRALWAALSSLDAAISLLNWYYAINGVAILLLIARLLRAMDFQPRLGVVTRALRLAGPDLLHFFVVAGSVFICYCMMGFLIFGNSLPWFDTFSHSINTCFEMLLGEFADVSSDLRALGGLQGAAGVLFFWSFELLVFLILLNFLLAIIVDAFSEVKGRTHETTGMHVELARLLLDKWRSLVGSVTGRYLGARQLGAIMRDWAGVVEQEEAAAAAAAASAAASTAAGQRGSDEAGSGEDGPRVLQVLGETLDDGALAQVLMAALSEDGPKGGPVPNPDEVAAAAAYAVSRFGKSARKVAEAALSQLGPVGQELESERDKLAAALERLAEVQRELAEAQRNLMAGQRQLAEQQGQLVAQVTARGGGYATG